MQKRINMDKKKISIILIAVILVCAVGVYAYRSHDEALKSQKRSAEVKDYQKQMLESMICEYGCPLKLQLYHNNTELLPEAKCVKNCTKEFVSSQKEKNITKEEMNKGNFMNDMQKIIQECKMTATNVTEMKIDNAQFFPCTEDNLKNMTSRFNN
jgi:hypothetical protein